MEDFVCIDITPIHDYGHDFILKEIKNELSQFFWFSNENDSQGRYISGLDKNNISIKLWLDEQPVSISISFRQETQNQKSKGDNKNERDTIIEKVIAFANKNIGYSKILQ